MLQQLSQPEEKNILLFSQMVTQKTILHFHPSNEKFLYEPNNKKLYRNLFSQADLVLVLSEQWKNGLKMLSM